MGFKSGHGQWGSLLTGGLGLDMAMGLYLGGGGGSLPGRWRRVSTSAVGWAAMVFNLRFLFLVGRLNEIGFNMVYSIVYF